MSLSSIFPLPLHPYFLALSCSIICSFFIFLSLCPILCKLIVIVLVVFFIFHALWHCHSCLCCRDVVAIELLWLRDSLIVRGWAGAVKSIQCSEWFLPHTRQCWKLLSFFNQIGRASECEKVDRQNLLGVAIQPMLTLGVSRSGVGGGEHHGCGSEHHRRGVSECVWSVHSLTELRIFKKN